MLYYLTIFLGYIVHSRVSWPPGATTIGGLAHTALPGLFMSPCHWFIDPEMIGYIRHDYSIGIGFCGW